MLNAAFYAPYPRLLQCTASLLLKSGSPVLTCVSECAQPTDLSIGALFRKRAEADVPRVVMSSAAQWAMTLCRATVWERLENMSRQR